MQQQDREAGSLPGAWPSLSEEEALALHLDGALVKLHTCHPCRRTGEAPVVQGQTGKEPQNTLPTWDREAARRGQGSLRERQGGLQEATRTLHVPSDEEARVSFMLLPLNGVALGFGFPF